MRVTGDGTGMKSKSEKIEAPLTVQGDVFLQFPIQNPTNLVA